MSLPQNPEGLYDMSLPQNPEGTAAERLAVFNAVRGTAGAQKYFDYPESGRQDVLFQLADIEQVMIGQPFHVDVSVTVSGG